MTRLLRAFERRRYYVYAPLRSALSGDPLGLQRPLLERAEASRAIGHARGSVTRRFRFLLLLRLRHRDVQILQLLLLALIRRIHHQIRRILHLRESHDVADR